jgi:hypothetical protein
MATTFSVVTPTEHSFIDPPTRRDEHWSGISWSAVLGGAVVAAAISLIMLALGAGFGLSVVSPWASVGTTASTLGAAAILWLFLTQVISYALGGYMTGRLRTKWVSVHTDEVYFRDTANGFLSWAVGVVMTVAFLVTAGSTMMGIRTDATPADPRAYFVDRLFRSDASAAQPMDPSIQSEASAIFTNILSANGAAADQAYLSKMVSATTGLSQSDADQRVSQVATDARRAEDLARQGASRFLLWSFLALLTAAFCASYAATIGGRQRDHVKAI